MKMNEKLNNNQGNKEHNLFHKYSHIIIIILLLIVCALLICQNMKINRIHRWLKNPKIMAMKNYISKEDARFHDSRFGNRIEMDDKRTKEDFRKIKDRFEARREHADKDRGAFSFFTRENHDKEKGIFVVEVGIPDNITKKNVTIELKNNILEIAFSKTEEVRNGDSTVQNFIGFSRFFVTPATKAKTADVKYEIDNGVLTAVIPIL